MFGTSATHGPHHVAQKSTSTTLPASAAWSKGLPSSSVPEICIGLPGRESRRSVPAKLAAISLICGFSLLASSGANVRRLSVASASPSGTCSKALASCIASPAASPSSGLASRIAAVRAITAAPFSRLPDENISCASATRRSRSASRASSGDGPFTSVAANAFIAAPDCSSPSRPSIMRLSSLSFAARTAISPCGLPARIRSAASTETRPTSCMYCIISSRERGRVAGRWRPSTNSSSCSGVPSGSGGTCGPPRAAGALPAAGAFAAGWAWTIVARPQVTARRLTASRTATGERGRAGQDDIDRAMGASQRVAAEHASAR